ncbi:ABC transporter ATP-binding protein [Enterocloster clostridioformis]|uniref:ABC transporter ATP-binding protein n=1 Tax=Enterocloster clostridioformis TaxID=1531 RepID=UPI00233018B3|nr:ABC transporter ATP-binding protein [Enterocloster clostridioformis]MDB2131746.1 ABC transporter ATP-binding protein [Enterocloster clostridioformis]
MRELFKKHFALTDKGAKDLQKASAASFFAYVINFFPAMLLLLLVDELLLNNVKETGLYLWGSILVLAVMWILLRIEYDALYNTTYQESANLRTEIADILTKLPLSYFSRHDLSDLAQTIMADVAAIEHAMSHAMAKAVGFLFFFPLLSVLLLLGNVKLGLAIILPILLGFGLLLLSKNLQIRESFKHYQKLRDNSESFQEAIENQQEIKSFGLTQKIRQTLYQKMEESEKIHLCAEISAGIPMLCSNVILQFAFVLVILIGVQMLHTGEINILYFLGYVLASIKVRESVEAVSMNVAELYYLDSMCKRIREIRETKIQQGKDQTISSYDIEFDQVSFSYDKDTEVLKNISFAAKQNEVTALVGVSGCGKTSILRLMSRLYDYDSGSIRIGGLDIKEISTKSLFEKIAIVFQDLTLFNASVLENIRIGKKTATDEEVIQAARLANCEEFIRRLPEGYKTMIGENGATLSGGERQRLSIARAFLKDSPIIILDEIAASLDVENEKKIQDSLNRLILDKTVVIISHRLKSVENADKIVVIDCGRVEASGTHLELLKTSPTYNNLVEKAKLTEEFQY